MTSRKSPKRKFFEMVAAEGTACDHKGFWAPGNGFPWIGGADRVPVGEQAVKTLLLHIASPYGKYLRQDACMACMYADIMRESRSGPMREKIVACLMDLFEQAKDQTHEAKLVELIMGWQHLFGSLVILSNARKRLKEILSTWTAAPLKLVGAIVTKNVVYGRPSLDQLFTGDSQGTDAQSLSYYLKQQQWIEPIEPGLIPWRLWKHFLNEPCPCNDCYKTDRYRGQGALNSNTMFQNRCRLFPENIPPHLVKDCPRFFPDALTHPPWYGFMKDLPLRLIFNHVTREPTAERNTADSQPMWSASLPLSVQGESFGQSPAMALFMDVTNTDPWESLAQAVFVWVKKNSNWISSTAHSLTWPEVYAAYTEHGRVDVRVPLPQQMFPNDSNDGHMQRVVNELVRLNDVARALRHAGAGAAAGVGAVLAATSCLDNLLGILEKTQFSKVPKTVPVLTEWVLPSDLVFVFKRSLLDDLLRPPRFTKFRPAHFRWLSQEMKERIFCMFLCVGRLVYGTDLATPENGKTPLPDNAEGLHMLGDLLMTCDWTGVCRSKKSEPKRVVPIPADPPYAIGPPPHDYFGPEALARQRGEPAPNTNLFGSGLGLATIDNDCYKFRSAFVKLEGRPYEDSWSTYCKQTGSVVKAHERYIHVQFADGMVRRFPAECCTVEEWP